MGKGARLRRERREREASSRAAPRGGRAGDIDPLEALLEVSSAAELEGLIGRRPEVLGDRVLEGIEGMGRPDGFAAGAIRLRELVLGARQDPRTAWGAYSRHMAAAEEVGQELVEEVERIDTAAADGRPADVIRLVEQSLPKAIEAGLGLAVGYLRVQRGKALFVLGSDDRAENLDAAIASLQAALPLIPDDDQRADVLMTAGNAFLERVNGDRGENLDQAIELLEQALALLGPSSSPELWAIVRHNLANAFHRRERGNRIDNLTEAERLAREALEYRSPRRNAIDWAHTQITLGVIVEDLGRARGEDLAEAERVFESVIEARDLVAEDWLIGAAHNSLGRIKRLASERTTEQLVAAAESGEDDPERQALLEAARDHLLDAARLIGPATDPLLPGRVLKDLSRVQEELEDTEAAIDSARDALAILRPTSSPRDCVDAGERLGRLQATRGEWPEAAVAFGDAVEAAELAFHSRLDTESRDKEANAAGNLARWAAFALAVVGDPVRAALVLEGGRTRELRRRLGSRDAEPLEDLPAELRDAYVRALDDLAAAPLDGGAWESGRRLQGVVGVIRSIPGYEAFGASTDKADFVGALEEDWPLIYVNPAPWGTVLLRVVLGGDGASIDATVISEPTSLELYLRLSTGDAIERLDSLESIEPRSYLAAAAGYRDDDQDFADDIEQSLPWLGQMISLPIRNVLRDVGATGATLIPCGPVGVAPLGAATWEEDGRSGCLLDEFDIRYAASAVMQSASLSRARALAHTSEPTLVALSDPTDDLPAAGPEVTAIADRLNWGTCYCAHGDEATVEFLEDHASQANFVHLACHASASVLESGEPGIYLADRDLPAAELPTLNAHQARLAVISACQTALSSLVELPDEALSIGNAMLAAGPACAVASMWPVSDLSTALLMTRMYEEIFDGGHRPPEALRRAQLWLRDLDQASKGAFLAAHPALAREFRRREARGEGPRRRGASAPSSGDRPFKHPEFWAAFVAVGA